MLTKNCPVCTANFVGRSDKKYCSDACRNSFNNQLQSDLGKEIRKTNRILRKNREILDKYILLGMKKVSLFSLISEGFVLTYFTNLHKKMTGEEVYFCYDLGYQLADNEVVHIISKIRFEKELTLCVIEEL